MPFNRAPPAAFAARCSRHIRTFALELRQQADVFAAAPYGTCFHSTGFSCLKWVHSLGAAPYGTCDELVSDLKF